MPVTTDRSTLLSKISVIEERLAELKSETRLTEKRLDSLRHALWNPERSTSAGTSQAIRVSCRVDHTVAKIVSLFRSVFRGRDDIHPQRWINSKTGKKGSSPVCQNERVRGVCDKPRIKCGDCPNQSFLSVTDKTLLDQLQGRHVVGVYPLLRDETFRFLAVDLHKASWKDDVAAFSRSCEGFNLPIAIERSQTETAPMWVFLRGTVAGVNRGQDGLSSHHRNQVASSYGITVALDDIPTTGSTIEAEFTGKPSPSQEYAANRMLPNDTGVFVAPPGVRARQYLRPLWQLPANAASSFLFIANRY
jgi:hypothetical protein